MPELFDDVREKPELASSGSAGRSFDWGPPAIGVSENIKEYSIYLLIAVLIAGVGWLLIDTGPEMPRGSAAKNAEQADEAEVAGDVDAPPVPRDEPAAAKVTVTPGEVVPIVATPRFHVQLGAFGDEETARTTVEALRQQGHVATFTVPDDQYEMYRVLMGPFAQEAEAEALARRLNELDFPCFVVESANIQSREEE
ncbi:MAG TPA: SPOR domain-containing protein [Candidatus Ozemobacteraceae bacterium]|nr:SPOR domain-containing protein [Candidatus Ozemobacteraceae bacterium]HQG29634.1 SPOR domain-containing protein [Candidatus Ozemobacteraceae bacterium]